MAGEVSIICRIAQERYRDAALWRNLWTILLFVLGAVVVVFLALVILFSLRQDWLPAALTALGTIVDGTAIKWIADRRRDAVEEDEKAFEEVKEVCKDVTKAENLRGSLRLLGRLR